MIFIHDASRRYVTNPRIHPIRESTSRIILYQDFIEPEELLNYLHTYILSIDYRKRYAYNCTL
jgi:hypothetical protein